MILTGNKIREELAKDRISISPFNVDQVQPNSYDFRIDNTILVLKSSVFDPKKKHTYNKIKIGNNGYLLEPNKLYIANTIEEMGSSNFIAKIFAKNSIANLGLFIHCSAPISQLGFIGQWTLELRCIKPFLIYPKLKIGQISFWKSIGQPTFYEGKYKNSIGPITSSMHKDF